MKKNMNRIGAIPPVSWGSESDGVVLELAQPARTTTAEALGELVLQAVASADAETAEIS
jgi:hypothetical protein